MNEATAFLARCKQLLSLSLDSYGDEDEDLRRAQGKVERALERLRRAAVKLLDAASREVEMGGVKAFLDGVVRVYEGFEVRDLVYFPSGGLMMILMCVCYRSNIWISSPPPLTRCSCSRERRWSARSTIRTP
jgi:hypothetical protein